MGIVCSLLECEMKASLLCCIWIIGSTRPPSCQLRADEYGSIFSLNAETLASVRETPVLGLTSVCEAGGEEVMVFCFLRFLTLHIYQNLVFQCELCWALKIAEASESRHSEGLFGIHHCLSWWVTTAWVAGLISQVCIFSIRVLLPASFSIYKKPALYLVFHCGCKKEQLWRLNIEYVHPM